MTIFPQGILMSFYMCKITCLLNFGPGPFLDVQNSTLPELSGAPDAPRRSQALPIAARRSSGAPRRSQTISIAPRRSQALAGVWLKEFADRPTRPKGN